MREVPPEPRPLAGGTRYALLCLITAAGAGLRFYHLGAEPMWFDEAYTALSVQLPIGGILERLRGEGNAPLYYLLMHVWTAWFGDGEVTMRFVSALLGTATLPLLYVVGARMFSAPAGLIAAALAALSPLHIHYSQEARMYPLVPPFAICALFGLQRLLLAPSRAAVLAFALPAAAGLYTQYYFLFLLPLAGAALLAPDRRRSVPLAAVAVLLAGLAFAPWLPSFLEQARNSSPDWIGTFWRERSLAYAVPWSLQSLGPGASYPRWATFKFASSTPGAVVSLGLAAFLLAAAVSDLWRAPPKQMLDTVAAPPDRHAAPAREQRISLALALGAVLVPLVLAWTVSLLRRPVYVVARYDLIAWGAYCLLAGAVLSRRRLPLAVAVLVLWMGLSLYTLWPYLTTQRPKRVWADQGDRIATMLTERARPGEGVIFTAATRTMTQYYLRHEPDRFRLSSYPLGTDEHLGWIDDRVHRDPRFAAAEAQRFAAWFADAAEPPPVVWIVAPRSRGTAPLLAELKRRGYVEDPTRSAGLLLCLRRSAS